MLEMKKLNFDRLIVQRKEGERFFVEAEKNNFPLFKDENNKPLDLVYLYSLLDVTQILRIFGEKNEEEMIRAIEDIVEMFDPNDPYWTA